MITHLYGHTRTLLEVHSTRELNEYRELWEPGGLQRMRTIRNPAELGHRALRLWQQHTPQQRRGRSAQGRR